MVEKLLTLLVRLAIISIFCGHGVLIAKCLKGAHALKSTIATQNTTVYDCFVKRSDTNSFDASNRCKGCGCPNTDHDDN